MKNGMPLPLVRIFVFVYCTILAYSFYDSVQPWTLDDAFISFRYAENWIDGHGLVYNEGEYIEGYTSFLWVVLIAVFYGVGIPSLYTAKFFCLFSSLVVFWVVMFSHRFYSKIQKQDSLTAALLLGTCGVFIPWSFSGMEVSFFCFLTVMTVFHYLHVSRNSESRLQSCMTGLFCALGVLCRPEGVLVAGVILFDFTVLAYKNSEIKPLHLLLKPLHKQNVLFFLLPILLAILSQLIFRIMYYGDWLPNTYYAKVGFSMDQMPRGVDYVLDFLWCMLGMLGIAAIALWRGRMISFHDGTYLMIVLPVFFLLYTVYVGGDSMPAFRFLVPVVPFICILAAISTRILINNRRMILFAVFALVVFNTYQLHFNWHIYGHILSDRVAEYGRYAGLWMKDKLPEDTVIATNTAGSVAYYSELKTIDMLGLTDKHIARRSVENMGQGSAGHEKGDGRYVLSREPDVIQLGSSLGSIKPMFRSGVELFAIEEFHQEYEPEVVALPNGKDLIFYRRVKDTE